jgi:alpha-L-fucosidase
VSIASLGKSAKLLDRPVKKIQLLGSKEKLKWLQTAEALAIAQPDNVPSNLAILFKISMK